MVFNYIYDFLKDGLNFTEADYERHAGDLTDVNERKRNALQIKLHSAQSALKAVVRENDTISLKIIHYKEGSPILKTNNSRILKLEAQKEDLENTITRIKHEITGIEGNNLSISQFLNFTVDEEKVIDSQIRESYATLLKTEKLLNGRDDRT
ncbi:MAG: Resolvase/invertase-type recombinase catalytic protein [Patescibacteria group bacterium]|nr:hypothetical protein [Candidatus Saccharibacteria bacterium]MDQ5963831.1 Resolvase/invertase-type recombinase catalytic protein [Patescibacteria group bacterium]